jgi:hypothetical protein
MSLAPPFNRFDPKVGRIPRNLRPVLGDLVQRARGHLMARTNREIGFASQTIIWMRRRVDASRRAVPLDEGQRSAPYSDSPTHELFSFVEQFDIEGQGDLGKAKWYEYFAVLALVLIAQVIALDAQRRAFKRISARNRKHATAGSMVFAIEPIIEALTVAELLADWPALIEVIARKGKTKIQANAVRAANVRWTPESALRQKVINWYRELARADPEISALGAAKTIYKVHRAEIDAIREYEDPETKLARLIRKFKKGGALAK